MKLPFRKCRTQQITNRQLQQLRNKCKIINGKTRRKRSRNPRIRMMSMEMKKAKILTRMGQKKWAKKAKPGSMIHHYLQFKQQSSTCEMTGLSNKGTLNTWSKLISYGINSLAGMLTENISVYVSNKKSKRKHDLKKSKGRRSKETKIKSFLNNKCVTGRIKRRSSTRCTKLKWNKKKTLLFHQTSQLAHQNQMEVSLHFPWTKSMVPN